MFSARFRGLVQSDGCVGVGVVGAVSVLSKALVTSHSIGDFGARLVPPIDDRCEALHLLGRQRWQC
eukprot:SAG31_NODE_22041_length_535_cov_0.931193_1_plen_66_part_00